MEIVWSELETYLDSPSCIPEKGILKVEHLGEYKLEIWFEESKDVSVYELDFLPLLREEGSGEAFRPLLNRERFCVDSRLPLRQKRIPNFGTAISGR